MYHISGETNFDNSPKKSLVIRGAHSVGSLLISSRVRNQLIAAGMETLLDLQENNPVKIVGKVAQIHIHEILSVAFGGKYKPKWSKE